MRFTRINQVPKTSLLKHCTSQYPKLLDDSHLPMKRTLQVSMELWFLIAIMAWYCLSSSPSPFCLLSVRYTKLQEVFKKKKILQNSWMINMLFWPVVFEWNTEKKVRSCYSLLSSSRSSPSPNTWWSAAIETFLSFLSSLVAKSPATIIPPPVSEIASSSKSSPVSSEYAYLHKPKSNQFSWRPVF